MQMRKTKWTENVKCQTSSIGHKITRRDSMCLFLFSLCAWGGVAYDPIIDIWMYEKRDSQIFNYVNGRYLLKGKALGLKMDHHYLKSCGPIRKRKKYSLLFFKCLVMIFTRRLSGQNHNNMRKKQKGTLNLYPTKKKKKGSIRPSP